MAVDSILYELSLNARAVIVSRTEALIGVSVWYIGKRADPFDEQDTPAVVKITIPIRIREYLASRVI
jgi:hypothetical protein